MHSAHFRRARARRSGGARRRPLPPPRRGRQGATIREIEAKSGATVDIDQSTKDLGSCTVYIRGPEDPRRAPPRPPPCAPAPPSSLGRAALSWVRETQGGGRATPSRIAARCGLSLRLSALKKEQRAQGSWGPSPPMEA